MSGRMGWLIAVLALTLLGLGCPAQDDDDSAGDDDVSDDDDATDDDDDATDDDDDDDTGPPEEPFVTGTVYDVGGTPLAEMRVTFCQELCRFGTTDNDGVWVFDGLEPGEGVFDVIGHVNPDGRLFASWVEAVEVPATGSVELADVLLPELDGLVTVDSGSHDVGLGDDLVLTLDADTMTWPLGSAEAGAVEVPEASWPELGLAAYEILGVWALYPWNATLDDGEDPIAVDLPLRGAPDLDESFTVFSLSTEAHHFVEVGTADVDGDRVVTTAAAGLTQLTWVAYGLAL